MHFALRPTDTDVSIFKGTVGDVFPDQLPLARSAVDRDAINRQDPELITRMLTSPVCRVLLVDGARVAVERKLPTPGLLLVPGNNFPADWLPATSAQMAYLGADSDHPYFDVHAGTHRDDLLARIQDGNASKEIGCASLGASCATISDAEPGLITT